MHESHLPLFKTIYFPIAPSFFVYLSASSFTMSSQLTPLSTMRTIA